MKPWLGVFVRVNNRKKTHTYMDLLDADYPWVILDRADCWQNIHRSCKELFVNSRGQHTYTWFGSRFFFLTEEDAALFRSLVLISLPDKEATNG